MMKAFRVIKPIKYEKDGAIYYLCNHCTNNLSSSELDGLEPCDMPEKFVKYCARCNILTTPY